MRVTFEDVVQSFSEEAAYVSMISNVGEYSPVFSGEEKRILLSSPDILFYSPRLLLSFSSILQAEHHQSSLFGERNHENKSSSREVIHDPTFRSKIINS
jgi:hypothetical protein